MESEDVQGKRGGPTAAYLSFLTLKGTLRDMKEHGVPNRIDRSVFTNLSGGVVAQLLPALKFLTLTNDAGAPAPELRRLVEAVDTDNWPAELSALLRRAYAPMFSISLESATPREFDEKFRATYAGTDDVGRKSKTFFLNAAQDAGLKISPYILKGKKTRSAPTKRRVTKQGGASSGSERRGNVLPPPPPPTTTKLPSEVLLGYLEPKMSDVEQTALWTLLKYFKAKGQ